MAFIVLHAGQSASNVLSDFYYKKFAFALTDSPTGVADNSTVSPRTATLFCRYRRGPFLLSGDLLERLLHALPQLVALIAQVSSLSA